jgi:hypothetical protein
MSLVELTFIRERHLTLTDLTKSQITASNNALTTAYYCNELILHVHNYFLTGLFVRLYIFVRITCRRGSALHCVMDSGR